MGVWVRERRIDEVCGRRCAKRSLRGIVQKDVSSLGGLDNLGLRVQLTEARGLRQMADALVVSIVQQREERGQM